MLNVGPDDVHIIAYLNQVKSHLGLNKPALDYFTEEIGCWVNQRRRAPTPTDFSHYKPIFHLASFLRFDSKLLHGLNVLLQPSERLECPISQEEVKYFVISNSNGSKILSTTSSETFYPSSSDDLRKVICSEQSWRRLLDSDPEKDWLVCISQLLQLILDDPSTEARCFRRAYRCLRELARQSILPPSTFVNGVTGMTGYAVQGGAFADIYKGTMNGKPVCCRVLRMFETNIEDRDLLYKDFCSEVLVWRQLRHPNILPFIGANLKLFEPRFCFISPWMNNGDIMSYLKQHPDHDRYKTICEIVEGIEYLHGLDPPVTHKDIKGANVLVGDNLVCCLADFGLSSIVESHRLGRGSPAFEGSVCWAAPEIMDPTRCVTKHPKAGDIYALACTIYEIYTGDPPFLENNKHKTAATIMLSVLRGERPHLPPPGSWTDDERQLWWLVGLCWQDEPDERPKMHLIKQVLQDIGTYKAAKTDPAVPFQRINACLNLDVVEEWLKHERMPRGNQSSQPKNILQRRHKGLFGPNVYRESSVPALSLPHARPVNDASFSGSTGLFTPATPSFKTLDHTLEESNVFRFSEQALTILVEHSNPQNPMVDPKSETQSLPTPPSTPCPALLSSEYLEGHTPKDSSRVICPSNIGSLEARKCPERRRVLLGPRPQTFTSKFSYLKNSSPLNNLPSPLRRQTSPSFTDSS